MDNDSVEEFGPFVVYEQLGIGGMATVHRAELPSLAGVRKQVALKRLLPHLAMHRQIVESFVHEARLAAQLHHENIAQTFDLGKIGSTYYITMEYVPGPTLQQLLKHCQSAAGAIPLPVVLGILIQICDALDYAHNRTDEHGKPLHVIHRDVSPPNVIISNTGCVKLIDFGIAKVEGSTVRTATGVIKGKFNYIAPEYVGGKLDARADLFAVGCIAHELLTGRVLFDGKDDFDTYAQILEMPIQPPSRWSAACPLELDHVVLTALQRDPDQRWQSAAALRTALVNIAREHGAVATNAQLLEWVTWAFMQKQRRESTDLGRVIETLDQPSTGVRQIPPQLAPPPKPGNEFDQPLTTLPGVGQAGTPSMLMRSVNPFAATMAAPTFSPNVPVNPAPNAPRGSNVQPAAAPRVSSQVPAPAGSVAPRSLTELAGGAIATATPVDTAEPVRQPVPATPAHRFRDDESGVVVMPAKPRGRALRWVVSIVLVLLAAGAGVVAAAYFLGIQLPFLGR
ncbi:MAG TPA: protein kinase [Kofleriaceae bacterium]|nr:protein kinase [Kofleriaceae bacterium]